MRKLIYITAPKAKPDTGKGEQESTSKKVKNLKRKEKKRSFYMDSWSGSVDFDDEYEKLVFRMNPPR